MNASSPLPFDTTGLSAMEVLTRLLEHHGMAFDTLTDEQMTFLVIRYGTALPGVRHAQTQLAEFTPVHDENALVIRTERHQPTPDNVIDFQTAAALLRAAEDEEC